MGGLNGPGGPGGPGGSEVLVAADPVDDSAGVDAGSRAAAVPANAQAVQTGARHPLETLAGVAGNTTETLPSCWTTPRSMRNLIR